MSGIVQTSGKKQINSTSGSTTFTAPSNFTANNSVVIVVSFFANASRISGITVSGTAATKVVERLGDAGTYTEIWLAQNIAGGSANVVLSYTGIGNYVTCVFDEWDNFSASAGDATGGAGPTSSLAPSATTSGATAQASEVSYAGFTFSDSTILTTITPPAGYAEQFEELDSNSNVGGSAAYKVLSSIVTETATFATNASISWCAAIATFKLSGGGGGGSPLLMGQICL